ncbi:MAG: dihydroorotase, partial [Brevundimonas aurantiaca]
MSDTIIVFSDARLLDPATGRDGPATLIVQHGKIIEVAFERQFHTELGADFEIIDCDGHCLAPGLIDIRVKTGEPGAEPKETLKSASLAAAAGGVTTIVVQPDTDPAVDDPAMVDFIQRRGAALNLVNVRAAGAATKALDGQRMAEIGLMDEAGALYFTDGDKVIVNSRTLQ